MPPAFSMAMRSEVPERGRPVTMTSGSGAATAGSIGVRLSTEAGRFITVHIRMGIAPRAPVQAGEIAMGQGIARFHSQAGLESLDGLRIETHLCQDRTE